jgi:transcriptional regulator with XRE-family HTH domain
MKYSERLQNLLRELNLTQVQLAEIVGVDPSLLNQWVTGRAKPHLEHRATLDRLELEDVPALSPAIRKETVKAFREGKLRLKGVK